MIRGLLFDVNGTVVDIMTDEGNGDLYRMMSNFLDYQGISLPPDEVKRLYYEINKRQRRDSGEEFPEFKAKAIFSEIIDRFGSDYTRSLPEWRRRHLPRILAEMFRAASRFRLQLYPGVREVLDALSVNYRMAAVSDGQKIWAIPELRSVGLLDYFDPIIISSTHGYRKPDRRMFERMLIKMNLAPSEVIFIGNDMYRDIFGANRLGIKTVFYRSNQGEQKSAGAEPDYVINNFSELPEAVRFLSK